MADLPTPDQTALLMQLMHNGTPPDQQGPDLSDPSKVDWGALARQYQLTPGEVQQLQVPAPASGGSSLAQRLQALRPQARIGGLQLGTDGRKVTGRLPF
jgi:hypothetical protein